MKSAAGMPAGPRQPLLDRVRAMPWRFGFLPLLRRLSAGPDGAVAIGQARRPQQEAFRLGQAPDLAFAPREIAEVVLPDDGDLSPQAAAAGRPLRGNQPALPLIRLFGLGLLGPNSPLPLHFTEWVRERSHQHRDGTLANFLDLFHHRYLTSFYRAWAQAQAAAGLDRADDERFSGYVARLTGHDPLEIADSVLPTHARLSAAAHLAPDTRHADGLAQTLRHFFGLPVQLQECTLHWIAVDPDDRSRLARPHPSSLLGRGAMLGAAVADRQSRFRLVLGPLPLDRYLRFTPEGADLPRLVAWVRAFVGHEFFWDLELQLRADSMPPARLMGGAPSGPRLGWSTWLAAPCRAGPHATGMVFEPEISNRGFVRSTESTPTP
ncbi:type VI secretion system baseplate subunit TssG [Xylophilus sp. Kf1]|nr:type VI secretion system baseplate subunit TssG [Xylophilus sp. Kf1]